MSHVELPHGTLVGNDSGAAVAQVVAAQTAHLIAELARRGAARQAA